MHRHLQVVMGESLQAACRNEAVRCELQQTSADVRSQVQRWSENECTWSTFVTTKRTGRS